MDTLTDFQSVTVFAEIGVTIAGFGMLGNLLWIKPGSDHPALDAFRLGTIVNGGLVLSIAGLIPLVVSKFSLSSIYVWRISSFVVFSVLSFIVGYGVKRRFFDLKNLPMKIATKTVVISVCIEFLCLGLLFTNILLISEEMLQSFYYTALFLHTAIGFLLFAKTFTSLFNEHN